MSTIVLVDGPNLMNAVFRFFAAADSQLGPVTVRHEYFRDWFDIDRLVQATLPEERRINPFTDLGIITVHSRNSIGKKEKAPYRIEGGETSEAFWYRQGSNPCSSTLQVTLPQKSNGQEAGVDVALATYLFETAEQWSAAILFCNDYDLVPAVQALRRRGKRIYCAANLAASATSPLVSACQHFLPWNLDFLRADIQVFETVWPGGPLDVALKEKVLKSRNPTIHLSAGGIELRAVTSQFDASCAGTVNELTRPLSVLCDSPTNATSSSLRLSCRLSESADHLLCQPLVFEGLLRHKQMFDTAYWAQPLASRM